jgi:hypothetical protein
VPEGLELRASSQWKIYCRADAQSLLDMVDGRPDLVKFWRSTLIPEESFVASMLSSPTISGHEAMPPCYCSPWFIRWAGLGSHHPDWLSPADFDAMAEARNIPAGRPQDFEGGFDRLCAPLFARKFSSQLSGDVVDQIDSQLRH